MKIHSFAAYINRAGRARVILHVHSVLGLHPGGRPRDESYFVNLKGIHQCYHFHLNQTTRKAKEKKRECLPPAPLPLSASVHISLSLHITAICYLTGSE